MPESAPATRPILRPGEDDWPPPPKPSFTPAQPTFQPAEPTQQSPLPPQPAYEPEPGFEPGFAPGQPAFEPGQPGFEPGQPGFEPGQAAQQAYQPTQTGFQQPGWPGQPGEQAGWPGQAQPAGWPGQAQPAGWPEQPTQLSGAGGQAPAPGGPGVAGGAAGVAGVAGGAAPGNWGQQQPPRYAPEPGWPQQEPPGPGGMPGGRTAGPGGQWASPRPRRRHRGRRWVMALFSLIVLLILLFFVDRLAVKIAENDMADQFVSNGLPVKPSVTIQGFPFLTQVWPERDLHQIDISASDVPVPAGPVDIDITSIKATITGFHLKSFSSGTADHITGTMFVSFSDLTPALNALPGASVVLSADGPNLVTVNASLGPLSASAVAKVTYSGNTVTVQLVSNGSLLSGILGSLGPFSFSLPNGVPAGLRISNVSVTAQGVSATVSGSNVSLSESSS